jgi:hypothetical protein
MFNSFIELAEIGFDFLLVHSLLHAFGSNLQIPNFLLILQYLICDIWIQYDPCRQFYLGMQLSL